MILGDNIYLMKDLIKFNIFFLLVFSNLFFSEVEIKIGLGSCNDQRLPTPAWTALENEGLDAFFFLGDNVYGDVPSGELQNLKESYDLFSTTMPSWLKQTEKLFIWDDHDYGLNDGGGSYKYKIESQKLFNDFWNVPSDDIRRNREGVYFSTQKQISDKSILIIGLDTRYFRSDLTKANNAYVVNDKPEATVLGNDQWKWLKEELKKPHDILILATSIQLLATEHRFEKWSNFPNERAKILSLLNQLNSTVLVISGDRHRGGIYKSGKIVELTASALNKGIPPIPETDTLLQGKTHTVNNYGIVEFSNSYLSLFLKDENMNILESMKISLK
jgi:alkaline phosphatase D